MSVYTPLSVVEISQIATEYGLALTEIVPIQSGIENSNWFLADFSEKRWVLTLFEVLNAEQAGHLANLLAHLKQYNIPVAAPLATLKGGYLTQYQNKPAQIATRIHGAHLENPTPQECAEMGAQLAKMHLALQHYDLSSFRQKTPEEKHQHAWWVNLGQRLRSTLSTSDQNLLDDIFTTMQTLQQTLKNENKTLATGLIHGDLFRDNVLFHKQKISAILDFSEVTHDALLWDIAICINDFCSAWSYVTLDPLNTDALLSAYHAIRPLSTDEMDALPTYLAMAACRFWLSRLEIQQKNQNEGRVGVHILQKHPNEMRDMLALRLEYPLIWRAE